MFDLTKGNRKMYFCKNCFCHSKTQKALDNHQLNCNRPEFPKQIYVMPEAGTRLSFKNKRNEYECPIVIYADIECLTTKINETTCDTTKYQHQIPCSIGYKLVSRMTDFKDYPVKVHTGPNCIETFMKDLLEIDNNLAPQILDGDKIDMDDIRDRENFLNAKECFICKKEFTDKAGMGRQAVPNFATRKYRGCAHVQCYEREKSWFRIPVYFHNFRGYDGHLIIWGLAVEQGAKVDIIGQGMEKYLTLHWAKYIQFKDSMQFTGTTSLEALVENLKQSGKQLFFKLDEEFGLISSAKVDLLLRKGVFPYDWFDEWSKLEMKNLPERDDFYNSLKESDCSLSDFNHADHVWTAFKCKTFRDYMEHYLKCMCFLF